MGYGDEGFTIYDLQLWAEGLGITLWVFAISMIIGITIGIGIGLVRYYRLPFIGKLLMAISEFLKNSPVLVQLFLVYFGLSALLQIELSPNQAAIITLAANTAAFIAVIVISSIEAIDKKQLEAARSFAMDEVTILKRIIYPQSLAIAMPMLVGLLINQLQVTSLISVIGVYDLTRVGDIVNQRTFEPFIVWPVVGLTYFILAKIIGIIGSKLEKRFGSYRMMQEV
ncbi:amino acid ABC transporter permease [Pseudemcibacter aquimaris]|uniref:amino acid ABC transporter permease n=1 Tax=Pseudemcibacter aquimaris TaxID=2857064 RepID=UPI00201189FE|nr:amino acid ABC transporter permease [Pseudemcibacter aquimaris]MCC3860772.1 amino acid ABC transporter permease [Pseudemcibacter aquimaris]WDU59590.1 amino acid ABC transporter permease [Pseudemcibacter aquimaris]